MRIEKKTKCKGKAIVGIAVAVVMLTSVIAVMPTGSAVSKGDEYNYIGKETVVVQTVLVGQNIQFNKSETVNDFATKPVVYRYVSGELTDTWTPDSNWRIYNVNWPTTGAYYVSDDASDKQGQAQISVKDPKMPLKLKVETKEVSSIAVGSPGFKIDVAGINLFDNDKVDLVVIGPNGQIAYDTKNDQQFRNISVAELMANYGDDNLKTIGWDIGFYTFQVETRPEYACGLEAESSVQELKILKGEVAIEADTTSTVELKTVKLTVTGVAGDEIEVEATPCAGASFRKGMYDTPSGGCSFKDTIDADGVRKYAIEFNVTGTFMIKVTVTDSPGGVRNGKSDTVDIRVSKKEVTFDLPHEVVIGDVINIQGKANIGSYVDIWVDDILYDPLNDIEIENDGTFCEKVTTTDVGMIIPGSVRLKAWIDSDKNPGDSPPLTSADGSTKILVIAPSLIVNLSSTEVALGDSFTVCGTAPGSIYVDILTISPEGGGGHGINQASVADVPGMTRDKTAVSKTDAFFSKDLEVDYGADTGNYLVTVLTPGRDGVYGTTGESDILDAIATQFPGINLATETQEQIIAILKDLTAAAGSDDQLWIGSLQIEEPYIHLDPIPDVQVGDPLIVTGSTNRKDGTPIAITVNTREIFPQITSVEEGKFSTSFDTTGVSPGKYNVTADDGDGHYDVTTVVLIEVEGKISVSISTDKVVYYPEEAVQTEIHIQNPTDNVEIVLFNWYLGIPEKEIWKTMIAIPVMLPAGFDQTFTVPIPIGEWGKESFCGCYIVSLTDTKTGKVVSTDSTAWVYMPYAIEEITNEIG